ncbi:hypothetical protein MKW94_020410 [Papaver nudicaule]|uniref:Uncharacterized protein n=1 Tax=Papaver nudicaule TaxID=74823 RepID=A0AA41RNT2_PAPNU|nr:hypothetical protein [Papaver nudicaule]
MSGKVCTPVRRSERLMNKDYEYREESLCASTIGSFRNLMGIEKANSETSRLVAKRSDGLSSGGPPSSFADQNVPQKPLDGDAVGGNDLSMVVPLMRRIYLLPAITSLLLLLTLQRPQVAEKSNGKINNQSSSSSESLSSFMWFQTSGSWVVIQLIPSLEMKTLEYAGHGRSRNLVPSLGTEFQPLDLLPKQ